MNLRDLRGRDAYAILGVSPTASHDEIARARRERLRTTHPDVTAGADDTAKLINAAAAVLLDRARRREYDAVRHLQRDATPRREGEATGPGNSARRPDGHGENNAGRRESNTDRREGEATGHRESNGRYEEPSRRTPGTPRPKPPTSNAWLARPTLRVDSWWKMALLLVPPILCLLGLVLVPLVR